MQRNVWISQNGQSLQGWYVKAKPARQAPLLLYFGGNAEEVTGFLSYKDELPGIGMVTFNYRGYGGSDGQPGEQALFDDALRIYDHFGNLPEVDTRQIIVMGRSLGTGVAVYLAAQRPVHRLILTSPYDSIQSLAQAQYPYVPINWLLKHPFDSLVRAPRIKTPVLAFIGGNDRIIPASHAETLLQAWGGEMHKVLIPQADHNTLGNSQNYWQQIRDFLKVDNNGSL
ncbi:Alpha/beta hydrolase family protein [Candidatus Venteria ishoeyi]|uniref:Alpha/beta hydrolase family protein n=1 Tax=Candidatus Venteria ishoeyi TaxID=1899563 RepID=A0A1H6F5Z7_9GAMM|nr:Alpha/beta hydrolase family protein [Candidatus Venteria ishoeyi]